LFVLALFVPQPVLVSSWQGLLGTNVRPWASGMMSAIGIHALSALPWVALIVGVGLLWIEPELEEEAAQSVGAWRVLALVSLPQARASILAAALFVALQTATESCVTDLMQVPTLADEVRLQFASAQRAGLARTLLLSLPGMVLTWAMVLGVLAYLESRLPPLTQPRLMPRPLDLGSPVFRWSLVVHFMAMLLAPILGLVWKLGLTGHPSVWRADVAVHFLRAEASIRLQDLGLTLLTTVVTGGGVAGLALFGCWLGRESRWFRWLLFSVMTWVWVLPGPAVGIGLHDLIMEIVSWSSDGPLALALYRGPSPLPLMWVQAMRTLPVAVLFVWPVVRMIPREWFEEARLAGAGPLSEFVHVVVPMTGHAALITALACSALCLGEVAASGRVDTPGWQPYALMLLDRMHYSVENTLAALSLLMLAGIVAVAFVGAPIWQLVRRR
jgi:ABC-type Fe3+ transport system permease subunit